MVRTRRATRSIEKKEEATEDVESQQSETELSSVPQQVSSSESEEESDEGMSIDSDQDKKSSLQGHSRLFNPYRTLGIVSHGPFYLLPNQNSSNAMACAAIGERFHLLQCDKLQPVLVSQAVPAGQGETGPQIISHLVSDNSLSISMVAHGPKAAPRHVTLFQ